jgi:hypothetical protein
VASLAEYRENAAECFGWAKSAKSVKEREIFLQMAATWLMAVKSLEARSRHATYRNSPIPPDPRSAASESSPLVPEMLSSEEKAACACDRVSAYRTTTRRPYLSICRLTKC